MEEEFGYILNNKIYRRGFLNYPDREIGEVRNSEEESILFFKERFGNIEARVKEMEDQIAGNENKGSFLAKLIHLKKVLPEFDGLGNFGQLYNRLVDQEQFLNDLIQRNRNKNLEIKKAMLEELKLLKDHFNLREASLKIKEIKAKWIRTGAVSPEHKQDIEGRFNEYLSEFHERQSSFYEDRKKMLDDYLKQYKDLIEKARELSAGESRIDMNKFEELKLQWSRLPKLPVKLFLPLKDEFRKTLNNPLWLKTDEKPQKGSYNIREIKQAKLEIISKLDEYLHAFEPDNNLADTLKTNYKNLPKVFDKDVKLLDQKAYVLFDKIYDLMFAYNLGLRKINGFKGFPVERQCEILIKYLNDLIMKEKKELEKVKNNSGIIYSHDNNIQKMIDHRLKTKVRRIEIKTGLIDELKEGKIQITCKK